MAQSYLLPFPMGLSPGPFQPVSPGNQPGPSHQALAFQPGPSQKAAGFQAPFTRIQIW